MALPVKVLSTDTIDIGGEAVQFRSLSRSEVMRLQGFAGRADEAEVFILKCGTGCTEEEAQAFRDNNSVETAGLLIDAIIGLSGLLIKEGDPDPKLPTNGR